MEEIQLSVKARIIIFLITVFLLIFFLILILSLRINLVAYSTVVLGIFASLAFFIISLILKKNYLSIGPWIIFSVITILLTITEFDYYFVKDSQLHGILMLLIMSLLFFIALVKYWSMLEMIQ